MIRIAVINFAFFRYRYKKKRMRGKKCYFYRYLKFLIEKARAKNFNEKMQEDML